MAFGRGLELLTIQGGIINCGELANTPRGNCAASKLMADRYLSCPRNHAPQKLADIAEPIEGRHAIRLFAIDEFCRR